MLANVFTKALRDGRRSLLGWTIALAAVALMYASFYPSMRSPEMEAALEAYPQEIMEALQFDSSAAGYLNGSVFGLLGPALLVVCAIAMGGRAIAADEEAGTLDLLLAHPVSRARVALERYAALLASLVVVGLGILLALLAVREPAQLTGVRVGNLAAGVVQLVLLGAFFGALALALGGLTGRKATVYAVGGAVTVLAYVAHVVGPQVDSLRWTRRFSPFHWYLGGDPLRHGLQLGDCLLLAGGAAVLVALGTWAFTRRDVAV